MAPSTTPAKSAARSTSKSKSPPKPKSNTPSPHKNRRGRPPNSSLSLSQSNTPASPPNAAPLPQVHMPPEHVFKRTLDAYLASMDAYGHPRAGDALLLADQFTSLFSSCIVLHSSGSGKLDPAYTFESLERLIEDEVPTCQARYTRSDLVLMKDGKMVVLKEELYNVLCMVHAKMHRRNLGVGPGYIQQETARFVAERYFGVPKELVAEFVRLCPTCIELCSPSPVTSNVTWMPVATSAAYAGSVSPASPTPAAAPSMSSRRETFSRPGKRRPSVLDLDDGPSGSALSPPGLPSPPPMTPTDSPTSPKRFRSSRSQTFSSASVYANSAPKTAPLPSVSAFSPRRGTVSNAHTHHSPQLARRHAVSPRANVPIAASHSYGSISHQQRLPATQSGVGLNIIYNQGQSPDPHQRPVTPAAARSVTTGSTSTNERNRTASQLRMPPPPVERPTTSRGRASTVVTSTPEGVPVFTLPAVLPVPPSTAPTPRNGSARKEHGHGRQRSSTVVSPGSGSGPGYDSAVFFPRIGDKSLASPPLLESIDRRAGMWGSPDVPGPASSPVNERQPRLRRERGGTVVLSPPMRDGHGPPRMGKRVGTPYPRKTRTGEGEGGLPSDVGSPLACRQADDATRTTPRTPSTYQFASSSSNVFGSSGSGSPSPSYPPRVRFSESRSFEQMRDEKEREPVPMSFPLRECEVSRRMRAKCDVRDVKAERNVALNTYTTTPGRGQPQRAEVVEYEYGDAGTGDVDVGDVRMATPTPEDMIPRSLRDLTPSPLIGLEHVTSEFPGERERRTHHHRQNAPQEHGDIQEREDRHAPHHRVDTHLRTDTSSPAHVPSSPRRLEKALHQKQSVPSSPDMENYGASGNARSPVVKGKSRLVQEHSGVEKKRGSEDSSVGTRSPGLGARLRGNTGPKTKEGSPRVGGN